MDVFVVLVAVGADAAAPTFGFSARRWAPGACFDQTQRHIAYFGMVEGAQVHDVVFVDACFAGLIADGAPLDDRGVDAGAHPRDEGAAGFKSRLARRSSGWMLSSFANNFSMMGSSRDGSNTFFFLDRAASTVYNTHTCA